MQRDKQGDRDRIKLHAFIFRSDSSSKGLEKNTVSIFYSGVIEVGCTREVRIGGLLVRLTGVAETGWRNKNSDLSYESRHSFMDELIDLTTSVNSQELSKNKSTKLVIALMK
ncbi:hypothetical protein DICVIV_02788 [Dictyocaulus viviparus]|uniref:Uncharacterized protein n=1 Tax=Dictyocaulus viviparus TaxID=29172 RepID=A0A0D8Y4A5_DICVI|nr:hypothetical protein DICVIV_02788 [Dictyocaulus viviparus]